MYGFRQLCLNGFTLSPSPFSREILLQAFLYEHPELFSFNNMYENPEIIEEEVELGESKYRVDLLVALDRETLGIVEIKRGTFTRDDLDGQLVQRYLVKKDEVIKKVIDWEYFDDTPKVIGICVGEDMDMALQVELAKGITISIEKERIPVVGMAVRRFRSSTTDDTFITVDTYGQLNTKDRTKYDFGDIRGIGKGRVVWNVVARYVNTHPGITIADLLVVFPKSLVQGSRPIFLQPTEIKDMKRYFAKPHELFTLQDGQYALTTQSWSGKNFEKFLDYIRTSEKVGPMPPIKPTS